MLIKGTEFPIAATKYQQKHRQNGITGEVFVDVFAKEVPEDKAELWNSKGYKSIKRFAEAKQERANLQGEELSLYQALHKARWHVAMNQPSVYAVYTMGLDYDTPTYDGVSTVHNNGTQLGLINHLLMHGVTVPFEDKLSGIKTVFKPVDNLYQVDLFKTFKVEILDLNELKPETVARAKEKLTVLEDARREYRNKLFTKINEQMEDVLKFYQEHAIERKPEKIAWAQYFRAQEILKEYNASITVDDLYENPQILEAILLEVSVWARAFEINIKLNEGTPTIHTYKPAHWFKPPKVETTPDKKRLSQIKTVQKIRQSMKPDALNEIIQAYMQIAYYKEAGTELFLAEDFFLCECGNPVRNFPTPVLEEGWTLDTTLEAVQCEFCGKQY